MKSPNVYMADDLKTWDCEVLVNIDTPAGTLQKWVLARPEGDANFIDRLYLAYLVFIGELDALDWHEDKR